MPGRRRGIVSVVHGVHRNERQDQESGEKLRRASLASRDPRTRFYEPIGIEPHFNGKTETVF